jgi:hypothetical protein
MAKKKQFAGKKTKLAGLPLTQALASQAAGGASLPPLPTPSLALFTPPVLAWDEVSAGRGGPLAAAFLSLVRDLADLKSELQSPLKTATDRHQTYLPDRVPPEPRIKHALLQARQTLQDLQSLLSHP